MRQLTLSERPTHIRSYDFSRGIGKVADAVFREGSTTADADPSSVG